MAVIGNTNFYFSDLVLNVDGSVTYTNTPTPPGGVPSIETLTAAQFQGFYVNEWTVPKILANDHSWTFTPIHALAASVAIQQGKITAAQYETYLAGSTNQPVGAMKGYTTYDYVAGTTVPTVTQLATTPSLVSVNPNSATTVNVIVQATAAVAAAAKTLPSVTLNQQQMEKMYLAAFLRAPEKSGLDFWTGLLDSGKSLTEVGDVIFSLPIVEAIYAKGMTNTQFVTAIYNNVFGKAPDTQGLNYWLGQMTNGTHRGDLVMNMINAGLGTAVGTEGRDYIVNRFDSVHYAVQMQLKTGKELSVSDLLSMSGKVNATATTIATYQQSVDASIAQAPSHFVETQVVGTHDDAFHGVIA